MMHLNAILRALLVLLFFKPHEYALYAQNNMNFSWRKNTFVASTRNKVGNTDFLQSNSRGRPIIRDFPP